MSFEEQLAHAFETLTERLRGEIDQEVHRRTAEHVAAVPAQRASIEAGAAPHPAEDGASRQRLADGFEAIDRARSLTDILDTLETCARQESPRPEVWLIRGGGLHRWRGADARDEGNDTPPSSDQGIPLTIGGVPVALLVAEGRTANDESRTPNAGRRTTNVALLARYASKSLEAFTAFATARALTQHDIAERGLRNAEDDASEAATSEEETSEEDTSARRYARLLVSEIKLYHESAVIEGRRDRDLAARLGGEITRARVMYEQRVPPDVRRRADYFRDELVRTLADGDSSLLEVRT